MALFSIFHLRGFSIDYHKRVRKMNGEIWHPNWKLPSARAAALAWNDKMWKFEEYGNV